MAVKFRDRTKPLVGVLAVAQVGLMAAAGWSAGMSLVYYAGAVLGTAITLGALIFTADLERLESCWWCFQSVCWLTVVIASGLGRTVSLALVGLPRNGRKG